MLKVMMGFNGLRVSKPKIWLVFSFPHLIWKQLWHTEEQISGKQQWRRSGKRSWPQHSSSDLEPSLRTPHGTPPPGSKQYGSARTQSTGLFKIKPEIQKVKKNSLTLIWFRGTFDCSNTFSHFITIIFSIWDAIVHQTWHFNKQVYLKWQHQCFLVYNAASHCRSLEICFISQRVTFFI